MADQRSGGIAWTEQTWNPIRGCRRVNKDCIHCYAETVAARFSSPPVESDPDPALWRDGEPPVIKKAGPYFGLVDEKGRWNGTIRVIEDHLTDPLRWKRPRMVFVNSMSDLFFEDLPFKQIDRIVAVMALAAQHTFQVLTKRPARMAKYLSQHDVVERITAAMAVLPDDAPTRTARMAFIGTWPLRNIWWGASMGHQAAVDEFMPHLFDIRSHAAVVWASVEPQSESVVFGRRIHGLDWIVVGGESGTDARAFDLAWARALRSECAAGAVSFFMKQMGKNVFDSARPAGGMRVRLKDSTHGGDIAEWPDDLRVREFPR